jgi:hypothetical protein
MKTEDKMIMTITMRMELEMNAVRRGGGRPDSQPA